VNRQYWRAGCGPSCPNCQARELPGVLFIEFSSLRHRLGGALSAHIFVEIERGWGLAVRSSASRTQSGTFAPRNRDIRILILRNNPFAD